MKLTFNVGTEERHSVDFSFDPMWGRLAIAVDGADVVKTTRIASVSLLKSYEFTVGNEEKHAVRIEMTRKLFLAGFRPHDVKALVDGQLVAQGTAKMSRNQSIALIAIAVVAGAAAGIAVSLAFSP